MKAEIIKTDSKNITMHVTIPQSDSMLSSEEAIELAVNQAKLLATQQALSKFDKDGTPSKV